MAKLPRVTLVRTYGGDHDWHGELEAPEAVAGLRVDSPAWFAWLAAPTTTRFSYPVYDTTRGYIAGFMTVRKERRQRGGAYWVADRRCQGRLRKVYLGAARGVTQAALDRLAQTLLGAAQACSSPDETNEDSN